MVLSLLVEDRVDVGLFLFFLVFFALCSLAFSSLLGARLPVVIPFSPLLLSVLLNPSLPALSNRRPASAQSGQTICSGEKNICANLAGDKSERRKKDICRNILAARIR